mmetsp:Transcript_17937/g.39100  ORF Transcript_17937/g.39100 Transcript_17937/m.39100 type:complete len:206 (+) Transcript_17937:257-874(+)
MPSWEELIAESTGEEVDFPGDGADDVTLVSKAQLRLDEELHASGFSKEDAARDTELAYYEAHQQLNRDLEDVDEEDSEDEEDDNEESNENSKNDDVEAKENDEKKSDKNPNDDDEAPELIDMDEFHIQTGKPNDDGASFAGGVSIGGMSRMSQLSHAEAEQRARQRVRRHLEDRKKASGKKGAFKTRNTNKSYVKGKRVMNDLDF